MKEPGNIVLFGFMGTGKTAVARRLGERLGREVVEMDDEIERREGSPISRIFAERGEGYFRRRERELVRELSRRRNLVIATGGGVVLDPENVRDLERTGNAVCLAARPEVILERVAGQSHRPLLEGNDRDRAVEELLEARRPHYDRIARRIDTSDLSVEEVVELIVESLTSGKQ